MTCPDIFLMRHGQTMWNLQGRLQGRLDSNLTDQGKSQAADLARIIAPIQADRFSSPQGRAMETARIAFSDNSFRIDARLAEIDVGDFTGHCLSDLQKSHPKIFESGGIDWYDMTPSGEHFSQLHDRCREFLADLAGPALIVTHGITLRMLRVIAMDWPATRINDLPVEQGVVHAIRDRSHSVLRKTCNQAARGLDSPRHAG
ncbi:histidine phosphatase family protein [Paracoccus sp. Z330]|uniref:Histidine phosphatase family protein n=1 Tax=Paracoccus onchidii TaxID=3017813 RepID=A0ABT4Z9D0_9RHOB|nr:histidine phosphatase family protein [Paracoccus onchidii]MDB6175957.1 histidine phosphatase family protein [Paracoccus onchidii]